MADHPGSKIRSARKKKKLTQEQAAELAGINPKYLGEIERGLKNPTFGIVHKLADVLDARLCEIAGTKMCPKVAGDIHMKLSALLEGRKEHDKSKALRILEVFFE